MTTELLKYQIVSRIKRLIKEGRLFPQGEHNAEGVWWPTGQHLLEIVDRSGNYGAPSQQVKSHRGIERFVKACNSRDLDYCVTQYGGVSLADLPAERRPPVSYKRKPQLTGGTRGRPRLSEAQRRHLTTITLTHSERQAIKAKYGTVQKFVRIGAAYCVNEYNKEHKS